MSPTRDRRQSPSSASVRPDALLAGDPGGAARRSQRAPLQRVRFWCRILSHWRQTRGPRVPASLVMALAEAECAAALAELADSGGCEGPSAAALDAALERVRRKACSTGTSG